MVGDLGQFGVVSTAVALTVAGYDPSSGAGISADLKVFAAHGLFGVSAITALTVQSTQGVRGVEAVGARVLAETLACLADDVEIAGVKIGMLATAENVEAVSRFLRERGMARPHVIVDPVLRSSSGRELLSAEGVSRLKDELLPLAGWATPNTDELAVLTGMAVRDRATAERAAGRLGESFPGLNVLVTGGHLERPDDYIRLATGESRWLEGRRIETTSTHGTGCAFSSALLSRLLLGDEPTEAAARAKAFVAEAMAAARRIGRGRGPCLG